MIGNKNKSKSTKTPLAELQNLQSELHSLREKHIAALESELLVLEKEEVSQKARIDKTRDLLSQAKQRLKDQQNAKPSIQSRTQASIDTHQNNYDSYQTELASLRGKIFEQKLNIRKEKAVLKAITDTEKTLKPKEKAPTSAKYSKTSTPTAKPAPKAAAPKTKKPSPNVSPSKNENDAEKAEAETTPLAIKKEAESTPITPPPVAAKEQTAPEKPQVIEKPYAPPKRRVRRMSDIPSHPEKAADRLASLFDDF